MPFNICRNVKCKNDMCGHNLDVYLNDDTPHTKDFNYEFNCPACRKLGVLGGNSLGDVYDFENELPSNGVIARKIKKERNSKDLK